jgi:hypothetical protein
MDLGEESLEDVLDEVDELCTGDTDLGEEIEDMDLGVETGECVLDEGGESCGVESGEGVLDDVGEESVLIEESEELDESEDDDEGTSSGPCSLELDSATLLCMRWDILALTFSAVGSWVNGMEPLRSKYLHSLAAGR